MSFRDVTVIAVLLHTSWTCFEFPFCGHESGSRFRSVTEALGGRKGGVLSVTGMNGLFIEGQDGQTMWLQRPQIGRGW